MKFVRQKIKLNIALQSSSSEESSDFAMSDRSSGFGMSFIGEGSDSYLESSSDSEAVADSFELESSHGDLFELYFVLDNTRYHIDRTITSKSKEFAMSYFQHLLDKMFRQMVRMDK